jgi:hypothetical protein
MFYAELKLREKLGEVINIRYKPSFDIDINGKHFCRYSADYRYTELKPTYGDRIIELKSTGTRKDTAYRLRRKAAQLAHKIIVVEIVR